MSEFRLILNEDGARILDQDGNPVSRYTALALMDKLGEYYKRPACVYLLRHESEERYKIGMTAQGINSRISQIRYAEATSDIVLMHTIPCETTTEALKAERDLHLAFQHRRSHGEWFYLSVADVLSIQEIESGKALTLLTMVLDAYWNRKTLTSKEKAIVDDYISLLRGRLNDLEEKAK